MIELIDKEGGQSFPLEEQLGVGAATVVFRSGELAVKVFRADQAGYWASRQELWAAQQIGPHPNIVNVHGGGVAELPADGKTRPYITMEYIDGLPIREHRLSPHDVVDMASDLGKGIQHVHDAGLVLRDISPANVIRRSDGRFVVIDLAGVTTAYVKGDESTRQDGPTIGTWNTCNQTEIILGHASRETDVYGLGALMARALFKFVLVKERSDSDKLTDLRAMVDNNKEILDDPATELLIPVIERATDLDSSQRYSSVTVMLNDLRLAA